MVSPGAPHDRAQRVRPSDTWDTCGFGVNRCPSRPFRSAEGERPFIRNFDERESAGLRGGRRSASFTARGRRGYRRRPMRTALTRRVTVSLCAVALAATVWPRARESAAQPVSRDAAAPRDAAVDAAVEARIDAGMRCVPIEPGDEGEDAHPATRDAGAARDGSDGADACAAPRTVIDREGHCCLPGQSWRPGACAGLAATCAPGETRGEGNECTRRGGADAGASARLSEPPSVSVPVGMAVIPGGVMRFGGAWASIGPFAIDRTEVTAAAYARVCERRGVPRGARSVRRIGAATDGTRRQRLVGDGAEILRLERRAVAHRGRVGARRERHRREALPLGRARTRLLARAPRWLRRRAPRRERPPCWPEPVRSLGHGGQRGRVGGRRLRPRASRDDGRVAMDPTGPTSGAQRVVRGGSFNSIASELTCESRRGVDAREQRADVGFRCVRGLCSYAASASRAAKRSSRSRRPRRAPVSSPAARTSSTSIAESCVAAISRRR